MQRATGARRGGLGALLALLAALLVALSAGCKSSRPPPEGSGADVSNNAAGGDSQFAETGSIKPPTCGKKPDGSSCDCIDVPLFVDPPTIYFVLDHSLSMAVSNKWSQVRIVIGKITRSLARRANFGAAMYPAAGGDGCFPGGEIMSVRPGDPPSSGVDGPTTSALLAATRVPPAGGTPTSATLRALQPTLSTLPGQIFVILATDGAPNCNAGTTCGSDQCQPNMENFDGCPRNGSPNCCEPPGYWENCNDGSGTVAAINALRNINVPVYVVGLPGSQPYAATLDQMALAGGTALPASPMYFSVEASSADVMLATLKKVAAKITATCTFNLRETPADASHVNVYLDDVALPYEPVNGWTIDDKVVTLVGGACDRVKNGDVLDVRIISGCPRIEPR